jgi:hypothetical protein
MSIFEKKPKGDACYFPVKGDSHEYSHDAPLLTLVASSDEDDLMQSKKSNGARNLIQKCKNGLDELRATIHSGPALDEVASLSSSIASQESSMSSSLSLDDDEDLFQPGSQHSSSASDSLSDCSIESPPQEPSLDLRSLDGGKNISKLSQSPGIQLNFCGEGKCYLSKLDSDPVPVNDANKKAKGAKPPPQRGTSRNGKSDEN